jgi:hypothetical protein
MVESRIRRISPALARFQEVKNGANRRRAPNFAALVWFSSRSGNSRASRCCDTLNAAGKEVLGNWLGGQCRVYNAGKFHPKAMISVVALWDRAVGPCRRPGHATGAATVIEALADGSDLERLLEFGLLELGLLDLKKDLMIRDGIRAGVASTATITGNEQ